MGKLYYFSTHGTTLSVSLVLEVVGTAAAAAAWAAALRAPISKKDAIVFSCWLSEICDNVLCGVAQLNAKRLGDAFWGCHATPR